MTNREFDSIIETAITALFGMEGTDKEKGAMEFAGNILCELLDMRSEANKEV